MSDGNGRSLVTICWCSARLKVLPSRGSSISNATGSSALGEIRTAPETAIRWWVTLIVALIASNQSKRWWLSANGSESIESLANSWTSESIENLNTFIETALAGWMLIDFSPRITQRAFLDRHKSREASNLLPQTNELADNYSLERQISSRSLLIHVWKCFHESSRRTIERIMNVASSTCFMASTASSISHSSSVIAVKWN